MSASCRHVDTDAGGNCRNPACNYNSGSDLPPIPPGYHYDIRHPDPGRICDDCVISDGSMRGMTVAQVEALTERIAADGCANCGSPHDHGTHPDRCCDDTCPTGAP